MNNFTKDEPKETATPTYDELKDVLKIFQTHSAIIECKHQWNFNPLQQCVVCRKCGAVYK